MKKNNESPYFKDWTNKKLKDEFISLDSIVNQVGCYGKRDVEMLMGIEDEIINRGGQIETKKIVSFN